MAHMNIFNDDAFSVVSMTEAVSAMPFQPGFLGTLGLFEPEPVRTEMVSIEKRGTTLSIIPTSERGAPIPQQTRDGRDLRYFKTVRIAKGDTINASEIQGIRAFGSESELQTVEAEIRTRQEKLLRDVETTWEYHRLGAIMGKMLDADGSVIVDWFDFWGISEPSAINFALTTSTTEVRLKCHEVVRTMGRNSQGAMGPDAEVHAIAGDDFFDSLITHKAVKETYLNQQAAAELRTNLAWQSFTFGGIVWHNYRGADNFDDNATGGITALGVKSTEAKFFPRNARGVFKVALSPGESFEYVNTLGQPVYSMLVRDVQRNMWVKPEVYSYPLFFCRRPEVLLKAVKA
jgi:hypothetical protein